MHITAAVHTRQFFEAGVYCYEPVSLHPFPLERIEEMAKLMGGDGELK